MVGDHFDDSEPAPASTSPDVAGPIGDTPLDLGYTVTVDSFSGPLDLLLYLVRRTELDILEVPLSLIVDQFVETVRSWQDADLDVAGEFILMAATLLELKARTIAPPLEQAEEGADDEPAFDPRESLLRSLLAYRRFKEAAQGLDALEAARRPLLERQVREHVPEAPPEEGDFDLGEIDLSLLATTCERVLSRIGGLGPRTVVVDEMPLGVRIASMLDALAVRERATMSELLLGNHSRVVHITTMMATLELTRQRFIEVEQPEQFGEIALRLRSTEEREREPELPPPEPDGPKRRRRVPLVTFTAPESASAAVTDDDTVDATPEEPAENDEQRFLRELEEATRVTAVLAITANVEKSFNEHWYTLHPELKPVAPVVPPPAPVAEPVAKRIFPKRKEAPAAAPATEQPAATPVTETTAEIAVPSEVVATAPVAAAPIAEPASVVTDPVALVVETPVVAEAPTPVEPIVETSAPTVVNAIVAETQAQDAASVVESAPTVNVEPVVAPEVVPPTPSMEATTADVVSIAEPTVSAESAVVVAEVAAPTPVEVVAVAHESPTNEVSAPVIANEPAVVPEQRVLPVEEWPVMHAMPIPEEAPHPLDTVSSDDPAEVNALLAGQASRTVERDDEDDEDDEDLDPDELLADDPALVNAALQADRPRAPVERRSNHDVIIPPPTETTVWTAPVDHGQTAAEVDDEDVAASASAVDVPAPAIVDQFVVTAEPAVTETAVAESPTVAQPEIVTEAVESVVAEPVVAEPVVAEPVVEAAVVEAPVSPVQIVEPTPTTAPLILPEAPTEIPVQPPVASVAEELEPDDQDDVTDGLFANDPALIEAALQADVPRASIELHPIHDLTIPTATETTVWTAPVDRGQTAAEVDDELDERLEIAAAEVVTAEVVAAVVAPVAAAPAASAAPESVSVSQPPLVSAPSFVDPTPTTAPLMLPERAAEVPLIVELADSAPRAVIAATPVAPPASLVTAEPASDDPPPPADGPPPASPPPPPPSLTRADSPLPAPTTAPTTTPTATRPMSPPPRSKAWLLIAIFIAINAAWAGWTWFAWVPRDVLAVAATERSGAVDQEVLTWRFNLDVVDALAQSNPPELVPVITPSLPGRWYWNDARTLVFEAAGPLPLATTFTATLESERFRSVQGFRLHAPAQQTWSTPALAVSSAVVETFDREGTIIALSFNQPVDPLAIAQALSLDIIPAVSSVVEVVVPEDAVTELITTLNTPITTSDALVTTASPVDQSVPVNEPAAVANPAAVVADAAPAVVNVAEPVAVVAEPAVAVVAEPAVAVAKPVAAQVTAISTGFATTVRLQLVTPVRGTAALRLRAGTKGVGGPLGLVQAWEQRVSLQQTLHLTQAEASVPPHGDVRVDVAVSDPAAPRELLAPVVTVDPAVPVTVTTTDVGVSLVGAFVPGQSYRIAVAATWPDEPNTSGHVLSAYTAASAVNLTIPERPPGIWPLDEQVIDGRQRLAAHGVTRADVMLLTSEDECIASREVTWTTPGVAPAVLDLDDLTFDQPAAQYRLRVTVSGETPVHSDQTVVVEQLHVRPQALFAALTDWTIAVLAGNEDADVPVRVVRVASVKP